MSETSSFIAKFEKCGNEDLENIFRKNKSEEISESIVDNADVSLGLKIWSSVLSVLNDEEKLFDIVKDVSVILFSSSDEQNLYFLPFQVLPKLNRDQLTFKLVAD